MPSSIRLGLVLLKFFFVMLFPAMAAWCGSVAMGAGSPKMAIFCWMLTVIGCLIDLVVLSRFSRHFQAAYEVMERLAAGNAGLHQVGVESMLDALDDLRRCTSAASQMEGLPRAFVDGIAMIEGKFLRALSTHGIEAIEPESDFDPRIHHAIATEALPGVAPNKITHVYARGYRSRETGLLIRAAMVAVSPVGLSAADADAEENGLLREESGS